MSGAVTVRADEVVVGDLISFLGQTHLVTAIEAYDGLPGFPGRIAYAEPGWEIALFDGPGNVIEVIRAGATASRAAVESGTSTAARGAVSPHGASSLSRVVAGRAGHPAGGHPAPLPGSGRDVSPHVMAGSGEPSADSGRAGGTPSASAPTTAVPRSRGAVSPHGSAGASTGTQSASRPAAAG